VVEEPGARNTVIVVFEPPETTYAQPLMVGFSEFWMKMGTLLGIVPVNVMVI
jgi:hypothetical protein